ncbi:hypothetical protein TRICI_002274 [Trichomonascus ciferrii]|uniref:Uncharacterized protein n=1 Tax=Trichomonascus ciferrii TaxID=44093 RepID=A0A642V699_9ASCO|nr:hypothetical protein TRICI_002274 [Trichomonascus ciferrii]
MPWLRRRKREQQQQQQEGGAASEDKKKRKAAQQQQVEALDDDDDEVVLSYEEEMTLHHANQLPHSSHSYTAVAPSAAGKRLTTVTPTGTLSIESMMLQKQSSGSTDSVHSKQSSARRGRATLMKRLSRLSFIGSSKSPEEPAKSRSPSTTSGANNSNSNNNDNNNNTAQQHPAPPLSPPRSMRNNSSPSTSSLIFERSVQDFYSKEEKQYHGHNDDYIPPVLDASTSAITDHSLSPDKVDVISLKHDHGPHSHASTLPPSPSLSNGSAGQNERCVLSFCSFADIVNSETSDKSMSPPIPASPKLASADDDNEVSVASMSETLRRNTGESIKTH